jgi:hypothetical protein
VIPAFTLFGLAAAPCPPRHFELEPSVLGLDSSGAVLDPGAAPFVGFSVSPAICGAGIAVGVAVRLAVPSEGALGSSQRQNGENGEGNDLFHGFNFS